MAAALLATGVSAERTTSPIVEALKKDDFPEACRLHLEKVQRDPNANTFYVGTCYASGTGVPQDFARAAELFRKAMTEHEDHQAQSHLARLMVRGLIPGGTGEGLRLAREMAEWGGAEAEMIYGSLLGELRLQTDEAIRWLKRSAASGYPDGAYALAELYQKLGKPRDAKEWLRKGKELEEKRGTYADWVVYADSEAAKKRPSARDLYNRGARILIGQEKGPFEEAVELIREAAYDKFKDAEAQMGLFYLYGQGMPYDLEEAIYWLRRATLQGSPHGKQYLEQALAKNRL